MGNEVTQGLDLTWHSGKASLRMKSWPWNSAPGDSTEGAEAWQEGACLVQSLGERGGEDRHQRPCKVIGVWFWFFGSGD